MPSLHLCVTPLDTANIRLLDPPFQEVVSATTLVLPVALRGRAASRHSTASARRRAAHPPAPARRRSASFHQCPAFPSSERHNDDGIKNKPQQLHTGRRCSQKLLRDAALCWFTQATPFSPDTGTAAGRMLLPVNMG